MLEDLKALNASFDGIAAQLLAVGEKSGANALVSILRAEKLYGVVPKGTDSNPQSKVLIANRSSAEEIIDHGETLFT